MMKESIKRFIAHQLLSDRNGQPIGEADDLLGSGLVDSVGMTSLVLFIEDALEINVPPEDVTIENFISIERIVDYLIQRGAI